MNIVKPASINIPTNAPTELAVSKIINSQTLTSEIPELTTTDLSTVHLLGVQQDVQGLAIQTAASSNISSNKASTLNRMTRNLNMV